MQQRCRWADQPQQRCSVEHHIGFLRAPPLFRRELKHVSSS
jgi:hypothetical protein